MNIFVPSVVTILIRIASAIGGGTPVPVSPTPVYIQPAPAPYSSPTIGTAWSYSSQQMLPFTDRNRSWFVRSADHLWEFKYTNGAWYCRIVE